MACCARGKSPTGAIASMICCEVKCGESTGGAQFNFTPPTIALAPPIIAIRLIVPAASSGFDGSTGVFHKSAENDLLYHDPPDLFLQNSAFLI